MRAGGPTGTWSASTSTAPTIAPACSCAAPRNWPPASRPRRSSSWFLGAAATYAPADAWLVHGEWLAGRRETLVGEAAPGLFPGRDGERVIHQAVLGVSHTTGGNLTITAEYHHNGAGLDGGDWGRWFAAGRGASAGVRGDLWAVRSLARDRQEPLSRHHAFLRVQQPEFLTPDLTLAALANVDLVTGSLLAQGELGYALDAATTLALRVSRSFGADDSQFGSIPRAATLTLQATAHF